MLYRSVAARSALRAISSSNASVARSSLANNVFKAPLMSSARHPARPTTSPSFAVASYKPVTTALVRYASAKSADRDEKVAEEEDIDMMAGIRTEAKAVKDTFSLQGVPKEALYLGLAGVIPYVATSLETIYLVSQVEKAAAGAGDGVLFTGQSAELMLHMLEPIHIGYGAVILSFLGAIHWGLEWAEYGGRVGYRRYAAGVIAPAVAWPTLLMPIEYALITQFFAFTFLYYNDARAATRGWAPPWYGMYRFVLTFVVGASIVASLVGREQIVNSISTEHTITDKLNALLFLQKKEQEEADERRRAQLGQGEESE